MKKIMILLLTLAAGIPAYGQSSIYSVLDRVEENNASLAARRKLREAQILEARAGNSLENPDVEYIHAWGNPTTLGKSGELTLTQAFDFPTVYAQRNKLASIKAEQYGNEYSAYRQQVLLEAYNLCVDIIALRQKEKFLEWSVRNAEQAVEVFSRRVDTGDAGILELNNANYELVTARNAYNLNGIELASAVTRLANLNGGREIDFRDQEFPVLPEELPPFELMAERYADGSPEMLAAWNEVEAASRELKLSRSESLPKLSMGYRYEFSTGEKFNGIVMGMSIPMFGNRNNVKRAKAQSLYAEARLNEQHIDLMAGLGELYSRAGLLRQTLDEYNALLDHDRSAELLSKALSEGYITITEYFSQLKPVYELNTAMIETMREYQLAVARINMIDL